MGADKAAQELNLTDVNIKYWYSGSFQPNDDIATKMDNWYVGGTEVVFACGGGIYLSCQSAAEANDGKMIGVDVDQSNVSDRIITSAMKALSNSVVKALTDASANGWTWPQNYAGVCQYLALPTIAWVCPWRPLSSPPSPRSSTTPCSMPWPTAPWLWTTTATPM